MKICTTVSEKPRWTFEIAIFCQWTIHAHKPRHATQVNVEQWIAEWILPLRHLLHLDNNQDLLIFFCSRHHPSPHVWIKERRWRNVILTEEKGRKRTRYPNNTEENSMDWDFFFLKKEKKTDIKVHHILLNIFNVYLFFHLYRLSYYGWLCHEQKENKSVLSAR